MIALGGRTCYSPGMPRGARLDTPGVLHHVMVRGIEGRRIFRDDLDRQDFLRRLGEAAGRAGLSIYAWALMPNHTHLLLRVAEIPLARAMRSLLTGYAGHFNRRHRRRGHLFQNRYKSILVEEEPYFLELVRYIHLNPLRMGLAADLGELARYPYTGHAALLGTTPPPWQDAGAVLGRFGGHPGTARARYRTFVEAGASQGRRPELQGGGLVRSHGGWEAVQELRRGREQYMGDERILGGTAFVEAIRREVETRETPRRPLPTIEVVEGAVCRAAGVAVEQLSGQSRTRPVSRAREGAAYLWGMLAGQSLRLLARRYGISPQAVHRAAQRGAQCKAGWERVWNKLIQLTTSPKLRVDDLESRR